MLQSIRDRSQSWIMWVIVILLILLFALFGIQSYLQPDSDPPVAIADGQEISTQLFNAQYQRQRLRLQMNVGDSFQLSPDDEKELKEKVLDDMILQEILVNDALDHGQYVGDEQLAALIHQISAFREDGRFSQQRYEALLRNQGYSPGSFEYFFRRDLLVGQISSGLSRSVAMDPVLIEDALRVMQQTRSFDVMTIPVARFAQAPVSDEEVRSYYDAHLDEFVRPEQVAVEYVQLKREELAKEISISDADVEAAYETQKQQFTSEEERRARHILLLVHDDNEDAVKEKIQALHDQVVADPDSFADVASENSQDPGSVGQGGDLGFFARGIMDPAFEKAVFELAPGEISAPVRSQFGYHIIRLEEVHEASVKPLAEVRDDLVRQLQLEKVDLLFAERSEAFANLVFENEGSLAPVADQLGLPIINQPFFSRDVLTAEDNALERKFVDAAFSEEVRAGNNSEVLEMTDGSLLALRQLEYRPRTQLEFDEVKDAAMVKLRIENGKKKAREAGEPVLGQLQSGALDHDAAPTAAESFWSSHDNARHRQPEVNAEVLEFAFTMNRPPQDGIGYAGIQTTDGQYHIVALKSVRDGDPAKADPAIKAQLTTQLKSLYGAETFASFSRSRRARADVEIRQDRL